MQSGLPEIDDAASNRVNRLRMRPTTERQMNAMSKQRLRQFLGRRLRFSSLVLSVTLTALLLLKTAAGLWGTAGVTCGTILLAGVWCLTIHMILWQQTERLRGLRRMEAVIFGCSFAGLASLTFASLEAASHAHTFQEYLATSRESLLISTVMVLVYGIMIPNRSRRSLLIGSTLAAVPSAAVAISLLSHASVFAEFSISLRTQFAMESMIPLATAIGCAAVGAGVSERIRDLRTNIEELGSYALKERLGSGGMGDVYLAEHRQLKRLCAVKLIHPEKAGDSQVKACFEQEVKSTAGLTHPNTVQVYDYGTSHDGRFYYAMEFLEGLNLSQFVQQFGNMPSGRVIYLLKQICGALHEAWCNGLVHRDIKPSNIFLSERGRMFDVAKLLDFGLAQSALDQDAALHRVPTQIQGSPAFMCPEQASGLEPDCRGDIYSLGIVAWYLLTGHPPFRDEDPVMLIVAHATTHVPDFSGEMVFVPDDLSDVIMKCVARKPEDRFHTPRDLLLALEACTSCAEWTWQNAEDWWLANTATLGARNVQPAGGYTTAHGLSDHSDLAADPFDRTLIYEQHEFVTASGPIGQT